MATGVVVHLAWDLTLERPTLGGALVLRQEGELLARARRAAEIAVHWTAGEEGVVGGQPPATAGAVFGSSVFPCTLTTADAPTDSWPPARARAAAGFSYFTFERLVDWHRRTGQAPRLGWSAEVAAAAAAVRRRFRGLLVCLHLKYLAPYWPEDSNADPVAWSQFLRVRGRPGELDFLLLGDDLPSGVEGIPGVHRAVTEGIGLATQLCLVGLADGFVGMASGVCTAANFSDVPHVILKHPAHHAAEMEQEMVGVDRFPFAGERQRLWRRNADSATLREALELVLS